MEPKTQLSAELASMQPLRDCMEAVAGAIWEEVQSVDSGKRLSAPLLNDTSLDRTKWTPAAGHPGESDGAMKLGE